MFRRLLSYDIMYQGNSLLYYVHMADSIRWLCRTIKKIITFILMSFAIKLLRKEKKNNYLLSSYMKLA